MAGQYDTWIQLMQKDDSTRVITHEVYMSYKAIFFATKGDKRSSNELIDSLNTLEGVSSNAYLVALCQYFLNEKDKAFHTWKSNFHQIPADLRRDWLKSVSADYIFSPLVTDPRFEEIKKECGWKPLE